MILSIARRSGRRGDRGATALEFALVAPLLLLMMLGLMQYAYHLWALETAAATAREAARRLSVGTTWTCIESEARARLSQPSVDDSQISVTASEVVGSTPQSYVFANALAGDTVEVTVTLKSLDMNLFPLSGGGTVTESARVIVQNKPYLALSCL